MDDDAVLLLRSAGLEHLLTALRNEEVPQLKANHCTTMRMHGPHVAGWV